jgi:hypothetical protein
MGISSIVEYRDLLVGAAFSAPPGPGVLPEKKTWVESDREI